MVKINFNEPITRDNLDLTAYNKKFALADQFLETNELDKDQYRKLLLDHSTFSYLNFKIDNKRLKPYPYQDMILNDKHRYRYLECANQTGKEQPNSALILTPEGYKEIGSIMTGDEVFGSDGKNHNVLDVFPQGIKAIFRLTFSDGSVAECGSDHNWLYIHPKNRFKHKDNRSSNKDVGKCVVGNLREIISIDGFNPRPTKRVVIPVTKPVEFPEQDLPIHPYTVGVMLGDGSMSHNYCRQIASADEEIIDMVRSFLPDGIKIRKSNYSKYQHNIFSNYKSTWRKLFNASGLVMAKSENKKIPDKYLYSSPKQRLLLLKGLMDTDGTIGKKSDTEFYSKSKYLAEGVRFLVNSFGGKARISKKDAWYKNKAGEKVDCGVCYRVRISIDCINPFHLPRKAKLHYPTRYRKERILRTIEVVRHEESTCLWVDSPDNTYLTNECIVTHNSVISNIQGASNILRDHGKAHNECIISASLDLSKFQMRRIKQILQTMETIDWKEVEGDVDNVQAISVDIKDSNRPLGKKTLYTNLLLCAPCSAGSLGYDFHDMNLDEFEFWKDIDLQWFYGQIAKPRMYHTKGNMVITTNPNGSENYGAELTQLYKPDKINKQWHVYNFSYLDCPGHTEEDLEVEKVGLTRAQIESTLMAIRTLSDKYYFSADEIDSSISEKLTRESDWHGKSEQTHWFLDVGAKRDQSVLSGCTTRFDEIKKDAKDNFLLHIDVFKVHVYPAGYPISRVVGTFDETQATDGWHSQKSVKEYLEEYQVTKNVNPPIGVDVTGNSGISPLFKSIGVTPIDITFSGPKKWSMYQRMKYFYEQKLLHVVKNKEYLYQTKRIVVTRLKTSTYNRVGHEHDDDFDDVPDSIAGLITVADNPTVITPTMCVI